MGTTAVRVSHWGRTFVPGGGMALIPLPPDGYSRFPGKYVLYDWGPPSSILFDPTDDTIKVTWQLPSPWPWQSEALRRQHNGCSGAICHLSIVH